jgi:hypothetical protein
MSNVNTSPEAVERLAHFHSLSVDRYCANEESGLKACAHMTAATLRALLAERDALRAQASDILAENDALRFTLNNVKADVTRLRRSWLATIQTENSCPATGGGCLSKRCGCIEEMEMLMREDDARALPITPEPQEPKQ